jgi:hypothetical protein
MNVAITLRTCPLHLRAGGGREGVGLLRVAQRAPLPNPPLQAGEGVKSIARLRWVQC